MHQAENGWLCVAVSWSVFVRLWTSGFGIVVSRSSRLTDSFHDSFLGRLSINFLSSSIYGWIIPARWAPHHQISLLISRYGHTPFDMLETTA